MQSNDTHKISLPWALVILLALACAYLLATRAGVLEQISQPAPASGEVTFGDEIREGVAPVPALSQELSESLAQSTGFQALVSFTDDGFEPGSLTVQAGDTVRFTNNSSGNLLVRATDAADAPCEPGSFDSCKALEPQEFWEYTFPTAGTWHYSNESGTRTGVVTAE